MAINDFIKDLLSNKKTPISNLQLPLVQVNEQGGLETDPLKMAQAELGLKQASTPLTAKDRLFGREMTQDYQTVNPDTNQAEIGTLTNYKPGFFNDLASGYRENATQGFDVNNLAPQNKGLATRIGEGLGTLARFYDKPVGRLAVATGLSMLTGEANPLGEGVKAYVGRQTNMTKDKAYRQGLINMGVDEAQVNAIPGIVSDDVFSNIARAKQLQDYALYRQDMIDTQKENAKTLNNYRMAQLAEDVKQNELENYYKWQQLAQGWERINLDKDKDKNANVANDSQVVMNQLDELMKLHSQLPQQNAPRGTKKGVSTIIGKASDLGLRTDEVAAYEGVQNMMTNLVARKLAGEKGVMTDKDFDRAKKMLPNIYDTPQQAKAKYDALKLLYYANPNNVATSNTTSNNTTTQIGNYKVRVK